MARGKGQAWPADKVERRPVAALVPYARNARTHSEAQVAQIAASINEWGWTSPVLVDEDNEIIAGHGRILAAHKLGLDAVPCMVAKGWSEAQKRAYCIADNKLALNAGWDEDLLRLELDELDHLDFNIDLLGFDPIELDDLFKDIGDGGDATEVELNRLSDRFGIPPFTVLNAREGWWQDRKRAWLALGIESELGRDGGLLSNATERTGYGAGYDTSKGENAWGGSGTSIFDPVLAELAYRWWCPPGGTILDPFAGGSVRGVVASHLGRSYVGVELRAEQVEANRAQLGICGEPERVIWHQGDSGKIDKVCAGLEADYLFTCPPYADLEVYSDDADDLSNMAWLDFVQAYRAIIRKACALLKPNRFACVVVGDVRDPKGMYRNFPGATIEAFAGAGLKLYNEAILVTAVGSLPIRVGRQFDAGRKLGKTHQNVLVFVKGDPKKATEACGPCEFGAVDALAQPAGPAVELPDNMPELTPVEQHGDIWLKRDDLFVVAGVPGGKARTCWHLAQGAAGLVTAGSRASPQVNIVARVAARLGIPCNAHTPEGELSPEVLAAQAAGATVIQHKAGYNNVIVARARADAKTTGYREIPFGMECSEAVEQTRKQVANIPPAVQRLVVPVGSGMSLAGILHGLDDCGRTDMPVLGVRVGSDPTKRLNKYAPAGWGKRVEMVTAPQDYHEAVDAVVGGVRLDPHYEAKCAQYLTPGDCLWVVGVRQSLT